MPEFELPKETEERITDKPIEPGKRGRKRLSDEERAIRKEKKAGWMRDYMKSYQKVPRVKLQRYRFTREKWLKAVDEVGKGALICAVCGLQWPRCALTVAKPVSPQEQMFVVCAGCKRVWYYEGKDIEKARSVVRDARKTESANASGNADGNADGNANADLRHD